MLATAAAVADLIWSQNQSILITIYIRRTLLAFKAAHFEIM